MSPPREALHPLWLLAAWLVLNLLQAGLTPLDADETYYWMYASRLDWGYFDHPPAVAVLISLGRDWLPGALGLRFGHVLAGTATVAATYFLLGRPRGQWLWLAAALVFAQPMLQVYGFIATPDGPLLLFTVLYLLAYRRFLAKPDLVGGALWGLTMAGLLYSKYHGVMLIFFSVLPNLPRLIRRPGAWVAAVGGAALFAPHLYWQLANDYPSFRYHLSGRDDAYRLSYTVQYLANQLLIFSPLLVYHYARAYAKADGRDDFVRACRWLVGGFLLFFLYTTTKGGTEAQWTALLSFPLVYLTFTVIRDRAPEWRTPVWRLCLATIGLLLVARVLLVTPREWLPFEKPFDHAPWVERLAGRAGDLPVVFENSYRLASLYEFYSGGRPAWTFTDTEYRPNQYDLWKRDTGLHHRRVLVLGQKNWNVTGTTAFRTQKSDMLLLGVDSFQVAKSVRLKNSLPVPAQLRAGGPLPLRVTATHALPEAAIRLNAPLPLDLYAILRYPDERQRFWKLDPLRTERLEAGTSVPLFEGTTSLPDDAPAGPAELQFGLGYRGMPPLRGQSVPVPVTVDRPRFRQSGN